MTDGFISVKLSPQVDNGNEITQAKANGKLCLSITPCPQIKNYQIEIQLCEVDPSLVQILNPTWESVCDESGAIVGFDAIGDLDCSTGYALELWMGTATQVDACTGEGAAGSFGYLLLPWLVGGAVGDLEIGGDAITFTFNGTSKRGAGWGRGPYPVQMKGGVPSKLNKPIGRRTDFRQFVTTAPPPTPACGCQTVNPLPADPAELVITRPTADQQLVQVRVNNHGSGPAVIDWGDQTPTTTVQDGQAAQHKYAASGDQTITVTDKAFPVTGKVSRKITLPLTPGSDQPAVTFAKASDPNDPNNQNCVTATVTLGKWAIRSAAEAANVDACQSGGVKTDRPDVWLDFGDRTKPVPVRLDPSTGTGTVTHCYRNAGYYNVIATRDDDNTIKGISQQQVPASGFSVTGAEQSRTADTVTYEFTASGAEGKTVVFDFGDGTAPVTVNTLPDKTATTQHVYNRE
ncbi:hypothetical protein ACFC1T_09580 [Kitasatospora sp. NPDC056076]|uniref:hypothetical protein n=1 Tax=Kitasatospora sp. NPDC056076 TaxID=3345703 RepID=UPI0035D6DB6A